jgi:hypothetical protein
MQAAETELAATNYSGRKQTAKNDKREPLASIEDSAPWYSRLFLSYLNPLLKVSTAGCCLCYLCSADSNSVALLRWFWR